MFYKTKIEKTVYNGINSTKEVTTGYLFGIPVVRREVVTKPSLERGY